MRPPGRRRLAQRVAAEVRRARRERGWSQLQLAETARLSPNYIGLIERGRRLPGLGVLLQLAGALGTTLQRLVFGAEQPWMAEAGACLRALPPPIRRGVIAMLRCALIAAERR